MTLMGAKELYGETPLEAYRRGFEAGYGYGWTDGCSGKEYDDRTPVERRAQTERGRSKADHGEGDTQ
jgi:hypothetical protein